MTENQGCGCGCGCEDNQEEEVIYLTLEDNTELKCNVLGIFDLDESEYIALIPEDEENVFLYKYIELEDEEFQIEAIESDEEFEKVSEAFYEIMDSEEYGTYEDLE